MTTQTERVSDERSGPDLASLLERVRSATGPDREIDGRIEVHFRIHPWGPFHWINRSPEVNFASYEGDVWLSGGAGKFPGSGWQSKPYTSSIDAALALVERLMPGASVNMLQVAKSCNAAVFPEGAGMMPTQVAPTLPLAILAALLTSLKERPHV